MLDQALNTPIMWHGIMLINFDKAMSKTMTKS